MARKGAIDILGRSYGLPESISTTNSGWLRTYPRDPQPTALIVLGYTPEATEAGFMNCHIVASTANSARGAGRGSTRAAEYLFVRSATAWLGEVLGRPAGLRLAGSEPCFRQSAERPTCE